MATYEELADLMNRQFTLTQSATQYAQPMSLASPQMPQPQPISYSITQHYHHSAHHAPQQTRSASLPTTNTETIATTLAHHGVDASTLLPAQLNLFATADQEQKLRLVELWRISPPLVSERARQYGSWPETSLAREKELARLRWDGSGNNSTPIFDEGIADDMMSDSEASTIPAPRTPLVGSWDSRMGGVSTQHGLAAEPYITSGYEALAAREYEAQALEYERTVQEAHARAAAREGRVMEAKQQFNHFGNACGMLVTGYRRSVDPVYRNVEEIHLHPNIAVVQEEEDQRRRMEERYGAVSGFRSAAEDEEML